MPLASFIKAIKPYQHGFNTRGNIIYDELKKKNNENKMIFLDVKTNFYQ